MTSVDTARRLHDIARHCTTLLDIWATAHDVGERHSLTWYGLRDAARHVRKRHCTIREAIIFHLIGKLSERDDGLSCRAAEADEVADGAVQSSGSRQCGGWAWPIGVSLHATARYCATLNDNARHCATLARHCTTWLDTARHLGDRA